MTEQEFEVEVLQSAIPVLVDFWSPACGPCRTMMPVVDELERNNVGKVKVIKVNVAEDASLAVKYDFNSIPYFMFFKNGVVHAQFAGLMSKTELQKVVDEMSK